MIQALAPILILQAAAQSEPPVPGWNCEDPEVQQEMNWCSAQYLKLVDAELNAQWEITAAKMKERDASFEESTPPSVDARPGWFASLLEAQRAWLKFRDAHCRVDGYSARGGSLEPFLVSSCKSFMTEVRTAQLRELSDSPD